jgi:hypothetical protein
MGRRQEDSEKPGNNKRTPIVMEEDLRMKGAELDQDHAEYHAARRWGSAVNNWGRLGKWDFLVCKDPLALPGMLAKLETA